MKALSELEMNQMCNEVFNTIQIINYIHFISAKFQASSSSSRKRSSLSLLSDYQSDYKFDQIILVDMDLTSIIMGL